LSRKFAGVCTLLLYGSLSETSTLYPGPSRSGMM
jgi:hypothetical protein